LRSVACQQDPSAVDSRTDRATAVPQRLPGQNGHQETVMIPPVSR